MTVAFHTAVYYSPPTPLGLLPGSFVVRHTCRHCREVVATEALVDHAKAHGYTDLGQAPA
jgi:hypothetical protein